jgi:hypothetical protein
MILSLESDGTGTASRRNRANRQMPRRRGAPRNKTVILFELEFDLDTCGDLGFRRCVKKHTKLLDPMRQSSFLGLPHGVKIFLSLQNADPSSPILVLSRTNRHGGDLHAPLRTPQSSNSTPGERIRGCDTRIHRYRACIRLGVFPWYVECVACACQLILPS